jgi:Tfp pilus assembly protein PilO
MAAPTMSKWGGFLWIDAAGVGVCLLASLIGYAAIVHPLVQRRSAAAQRQREMETRRQKATELEAAVRTAQERLTTARQQLAAGAVQLESAAHINKRIAGVTEFFSRCALHVDDVRTGRVSSGPQYDLVPITVLGRGGYRQCVQFLHGLCSQYPDMSVMRIELSGNPAEPADSGQFRLELFWYTAPDPEASRAAALRAEGAPWRGSAPKAA